MALWTLIDQCDYGIEIKIKWLKGYLIKLLCWYTAKGTWSTITSKHMATWTLIDWLKGFLMN